MDTVVPPATGQLAVDVPCVAEQPVICADAGKADRVRQERTVAVSSNQNTHATLIEASFYCVNRARAHLVDRCLRVAEEHARRYVRKGALHHDVHDQLRPGPRRGRAQHARRVDERRVRAVLQCSSGSGE